MTLKSVGLPIFLGLALMLGFQNCAPAKSSTSDSSSSSSVDSLNNGNGDYYPGEEQVVFFVDCAVVNQLSPTITQFNQIHLIPSVQGNVLIYDISVDALGIKKTYQHRTPLTARRGGQTSAITTTSAPLLQELGTPTFKVYAERSVSETFDFSVEINPYDGSNFSGHVKIQDPIATVDSIVQCRVRPDRISY